MADTIRLTASMKLRIEEIRELLLEDEKDTLSFMDSRPDLAEYCQRNIDKLSNMSERDIIEEALSIAWCRLDKLKDIRNKGE